MILLCYVNCAEQSAETVSSPAIREEGTKGLLHHLRFWTVSWSVCAAATVFQTLIYEEKKLPAVAEECLTGSAGWKVLVFRDNLLAVVSSRWKSRESETGQERERPGQAGACSFTICPLCHNTAKMTRSLGWKTKDLVSHLTYTQGNHPK